MPIPAGVYTPPVLPPVSSADVPAAWWICPADSCRYELTDTSRSSNWYTMQGVKGLWAAPVAITTDPAARGGTTVRYVAPDARLITWPLYVRGRSHSEFVAALRTIAGAFTRTSTAGPGTLIVARPDGTSRQIRAWYQDGWEESGGAGSGIRWDAAALTLYCPDPYWTDTDPVLITRKFGPTGLDFMNPYPTISSSAALGATTATNPGEILAWPDWTITGPASLITVTNETSGDQWVLDPTVVLGRALEAGETVRISGDPPAISGPGDDPWEPSVDWSVSDLWPLQPGDNQVTFDIAGAVAGTSITATFYPRYETA